MTALKVEGKEFNPQWDAETNFHWEEWPTYAEAAERRRQLEKMGAKVTLYEAE
jgi:hypothetical protein